MFPKTTWITLLWCANKLTKVDNGSLEKRFYPQNKGNYLEI